MSSGEVGRLIAIARRPARRAPMEEIDAVEITLSRGVEGDHKGVKFRNRAVTVLAREAWAEALADLAGPDGPPPLAWTVRRANLLVAGLRLPRARGAILRIGPVRLEVTCRTQPCRRMEEAWPGLLKALHSDWRGGVTCRVLAEGTVRIGDVAAIEHAPEERTPRLPG
ncbi:MAG: MOSC domain-containing protein [Pseudomonadota bacterium]